MSIKAVIVSLAKLESNYIEEWVRYHLGLGFEHIYLYDNEDKPTYEEILKKFSKQVSVIHMPYNNRKKQSNFVFLNTSNKIICIPIIILMLFIWTLMSLCV